MLVQKSNQQPLINQIQSKFACLWKAHIFDDIPNIQLGVIQKTEGEAVTQSTFIKLTIFISAIQFFWKKDLIK